MTPLVPHGLYLWSTCLVSSGNPWILWYRPAASAGSESSPETAISAGASPSMMPSMWLFVYRVTYKIYGLWSSSSLKWQCCGSLMTSEVVPIFGQLTRIKKVSFNVSLQCDQVSAWLFIETAFLTGCSKPATLLGLPSTSADTWHWLESYHGQAMKDAIMHTGAKALGPLLNYLVDVSTINCLNEVWSPSTSFGIFGSLNSLGQVALRFSLRGGIAHRTVPHRR